MPIEIIKKICPITFGLPTKMTQQGFERFCWEKQQNVVRTYNGTKNGRKTHPVCAVCKGAKPAELEIVLLEEKSMTLVTKPGDCPLCSGEGQAVAFDPDAGLRASCQVLAAATGPLPETVDNAHDHLGAGVHFSSRGGACLQSEHDDAAGREGSEAPAQRFAAFQEILGLSAEKDAVAILTAVAVLTQEFDRLRTRCAELAESLAAREKEIERRESIDDQEPLAASSAAGSVVYSSPV